MRVPTGPDQDMASPTGTGAARPARLRRHGQPAHWFDIAGPPVGAATSIPVWRLPARQTGRLALRRDRRSVEYLVGTRRQGGRGKASKWDGDFRIARPSSPRWDLLSQFRLTPADGCLYACGEGVPPDTRSVTPMHPQIPATTGAAPACSSPSSALQLTASRIPPVGRGPRLSSSPPGASLITCAFGGRPTIAAVLPLD